MTRTDGEHELVLGNKQLLSAFFVVVALLGVFFTMGYFVGKNTATAGFNAGPAGANNGPRPDPSKAADSGATAASAPVPDSTTPAVDPNATAAPSTPAPSTPEPEAKSAPAPAAAPAERESSKDDTVAQTGKEELYLQVSAVRRPDADNMVKVLRERGFPALLGESSKPGLFRVLVGPFKTHGDMGRAKSDLKAKGFESIVAK